MNKGSGCHKAQRNFEVNYKILTSPKSLGNQKARIKKLKKAAYSGFKTIKSLTYWLNGKGNSSPIELGELGTSDLGST